MEIQPITTGAVVTDPSPDLFTVLASDGSADPSGDPGLSRERAVELFEAMVTTRVVGARLSALAAEGRIGLFPSASGAEAAVVGAASVLRDRDWLFPTYGDFGAALVRGASVAQLAARALGGASDPLKGRDVPAAFSSRALRIASSGAGPANRLPHAVGLAWAAAQRGEELVSAAFFDAAEVDAADFHTGLNFAGVMRAPVLFVCRAPRGAAGAAEHAVAYGLPAVRCDGSDLLAVVRALGDAMDRAASGGGATVLDLVIGGPDDALDRARKHLVRLGAWDDAKERALVKRIEEQLASVVAAGASEPALRTIFDDVFAEAPPALEAQHAALVRGPRPRG